MSTGLTCPDKERWPILLAASLSPEQRQQLEHHLETCPSCQERLDAAEECRDELLQLARRVGDPTATPPDPALTQILEQLHGLRSPLQPTDDPADLYFLRASDRPGVLGLLGSYEVEGVIGQGGMGVVLKAFDPALHRLVAIKVLAAAVAGSATARKRFTREAKAAAAVCHEHVVAVHGVHEVDALPYLVMQYIAGESLQARLDRTGPLEVLEIVRIGMQTAAGLAAAHAQGLIHRDIKPANLLLENGVARVKITDFGLARMVDDVGLTQTGVVAGTPEYMAPEQARGEPVDHRADLFSLGSVLYAMCTGRPPFHGTTTLVLLREVSEAEPVPIRSLNPDVPAWLETLVTHLLAKDPAQRFQSAAEVARLLECYLSHLQQPGTVIAPELPPSTLAEPNRPWRSLAFSWPAYILAGVLLAVLGTGVTLFLAGAETDTNRESAQDFYQRFDENAANAPGLKLFGPQAERYVKYEPTGLRIALPAGYLGRRPPTGLVTTFGVKGDFEITASFEVVFEKGDPRSPNKLTGLSLAVVPQRPAETDLDLWIKPSQNMASLFRGPAVPDGSEYMACSTQWDAVAPKEDMNRRTFPTPTKAGRLRLSRTGAMLSYAVAEAGSDEFSQLASEPYEDSDLRQVRLVATTADAFASIDVRVSDLRIHAGALPKETPAVARRAGRLWPLLLIFPLVLALPFGVWLLVRRRAPKKPARAAGKKVPAEPETAAPHLVFPCPKCRKKLKVRAPLAGKKLKCPACGQKVLAPTAPRSDSEGAPPQSDATGIK
jgi:serine/threonine protein kinase